MEKKKKILILGAGVYQVPLIRRARERDLYTVVASTPGNYPGFQLADQVYHTNTTDQEAILKIARAEKIDAITTTGTDVAVVSIGHVCKEMHLPGIGAEAARILTDKALMKEAFAGYIKEVQEGTFPAAEHTYAISDEVIAEVKATLAAD